MDLPWGGMAESGLIFSDMWIAFLHLGVEKPCPCAMDLFDLVAGGPTDLSQENFAMERLVHCLFDLGGTALREEKSLAAERLPMASRRPMAER